MTQERFSRPLAVAFLALLLLVVADGAMARTIVDAAGRHVDIPDKVNRVMAAGPPANVTLYTLAPDKLVGWVHAPSAAERPFIAAPYVDLPEHPRLTGRNNTVNTEGVVALKPDVIIDIGTVSAPYAALADRVQAQTGVPYVLVDGTFARTAETYRQLGEIVGEPRRAAELAGYADRVMAMLRDRLATVPAGDRPRVYYGRGANGLQTGLAGSINLEVLDAAGAVNVAAAAGNGGLATVTLEQIVGWNPKVLLAQDEKFFNTVGQDPAWQGINAVRDKRIYRAPQVPWGWFDDPPAPNRLLGVRWLMAVLYPDRFPEDLRPIAQEFYQTFYHVNVSSQQLDELLKNR